MDESFGLDRAAALALDAQDELAGFREAFVVAEPALIYLLANSLGRLPKAAAARMAAVVEQEWGVRLIRGWNEGWMALPQRVGDKVGQLVGARPGEVLLADSTSVNLYKLALAALRARPGRGKILTDDLNFPSDLYILQGVAEAAGQGQRLQVVPSPDGIHGPVAGLLAAMDEDTALVALSLTLFKSGYTYDMAAVTAAAHAAGADLAVGCTYKYLCGGPGAPAFLYVRQELQEQLHNPVPGWMGQRKPFDLALQYADAPGLARFLSGTPAILSLAAVEPGVDLLLAAGMARVRAKSARQTAYLLALWRAFLQPLGFTLKSPLAAEQRGSHVTFGHPEGLRISQALKEEMRVIPDFRRPDNLRYAVAPLYNSYSELYEAVQRLAQVVTGRVYARYADDGLAVT